jgi:hypothetical protein
MKKFSTKSNLKNQETYFSAFLPRGKRSNDQKDQVWISLIYYKIFIEILLLLLIKERFSCV